MAEDKRPPKPEDWEWYSVCSAHREYSSECGCCNAGRWVSRRQEELQQWLYRNHYRVWFKWVNRVDSEDRQFLESVFPNLAKAGK